MTPPLREPLDRVRTEVERNAIRVRNGIKYFAGTEWTTPQPTPRDQVWKQGSATLWRYRSDHVTVSPPVLLFIGLVSRSSIFDLHEKVSLVAALRDAGMDVYVLDWGVPGVGDADNTLETYVGRYLPRAVRAMLRTSGATEVSVVGYCMGGAMALLGTAGVPGLPVRNLIVMATPVDFTEMPVQYDALRDPKQDFEAFVDPETGCIPPELVAASFRIRKPTADAVQLANLLENLWNDAYVGGHQAISRWTADHIPLPRGVARQVITGWMRRNAFVEGALMLDGRPVSLRSIRCPVLSILTLFDEVVPPAASRPIGDLVGSEEFELHEIDAGHIGLLIGRSANKGTYPKIIEWLHEHRDRKED